MSWKTVWIEKSHGLCLASWLKYDPILIKKIIQNYNNNKKLPFIPAFLAPYPEINSFEVTRSDITNKYIIHFKKFNFIQITYGDGISWRNPGKVLEFHFKKKCINHECYISVVPLLLQFSREQSGRWLICSPDRASSMKLWCTPEEFKPAIYLSSSVGCCSWN